MAYVTPLNDQGANRRRIMALGAVITVHGVMALAIFTGFAGGVIRIIEKQHLPAWNFVPPRPKIIPEPVPSPSAHPRTRDAKPVVPDPRDPMIDSKIDLGPTTLPTLPTGGGLGGDLLPPLPPPSPSPSFTPRAAKPLGAPGKWVSDADYPAGALRRGQQGAAAFELTIGPDGRVRDCRITRSSGSADLDAATCAKVSERASFTPARDTHGDLVAGSFSGVIRWRIPE
ncbi:energy transducer TonB [Novosphingobium sp.]|uniref:energy transducer TonB n=1 Tax=Novosphingobium sp. TaxID=1874826 RepID=UPI003BACD732